jgi:hypothetical protein
MWLAGPSQPLTHSPRSRRPQPKPTTITGAKLPTKYSAVKGRGFSTFEYMGPYEGGDKPSPRKAGASPRGEESSLPPDLANRPVFKHSALPPAPKNAGAFQRFRYTVDPFENFEDHKRREFLGTKSQPVAGAFNAGGNARDIRRNMKCRGPELLRAMKETLREDWPSFLRVETDDRGVLLAHFAGEKLASERRADLSSYMSRLLNTHPASMEFGLQKEPSCWGAVKPADNAARDGSARMREKAENVVYALRPPWVPNDGPQAAYKAAAAEHAQSHKPAVPAITE